MHQDTIEFLKTADAASGTLRSQCDVALSDLMNRIDNITSVARRLLRQCERAELNEPDPQIRPYFGESQNALRVFIDRAEKIEALTREMARTSRQFDGARERLRGPGTR